MRRMGSSARVLRNRKDSSSARYHATQKLPRGQPGRQAAAPAGEAPLGADHGQPNPRRAGGAAPAGSGRARGRLRAPGALAAPAREGGEDVSKPKLESGLRAAIYARMSTDRQSSDSPADQVAACRA